MRAKSLSKCLLNVFLLVFKTESICCWLFPNVWQGSKYVSGIYKIRAVLPAQARAIAKK